MTFFFYWPLQVAVFILMMVAYGSNLNAAVVGACTAVVAGVLWWYYMPETGVQSTNQWGMWAQATRNLVFVPYFMAIAMF